MGKDPAFLFYPGDWLGGTLGMSFEEKGAYMEVLMLQFNRGHMTSHMIRHVIGQHWDTLQVKFTQDTNGLWFNSRLEEEINKRKNFVSSRKNNIKGENQYTKKQKKDGHMTSHMENENENRNGVVIRNELKSKNEIFEELFTDDIFIEQLKITHKGKDLQSGFEECYTHHSNGPNPPKELWEWKQKLNTWLTIKSKDNVKRNTKQSVEERIDAYKEHFSKQGNQ